MRTTSHTTHRTVGLSLSPRRALTEGRYTLRVQGRETNEAAFETLVQTYLRLIRSAVRKVAGSDADRLGADIEQRLFTDLWKRYQKDEAIEHPSTYIYRAAVRETVRALKKDARRAEAPLPPLLAAPRKDDPHARLRGKEIEGAVNEALEAILPERARAVRFHLAGFAVDDIMALHGWSYGKARNLIARGMADVRQRLKRRGIDAS